MRAVAFIREEDAGCTPSPTALGSRLAGYAALFGLALLMAGPAQAGSPATFSLSQGGADFGLLSPYRHGLVNDLQIDPPGDIHWASSPNFTINKQWGNIGGWEFSSSHEFNTPLVSLNDVAYPGGGSLDSAQGSAQWLNLNSQFYFRHRFARSMTVTPSFGVELNAGGLASSELNQLGILFNPFHSAYSINTGIDVSGHFGNNWGYAADVEYFSISGQASEPVLGHKAMLFYEWDKHSRISLGYKYTNGLYNYSYADHAHPMLDFLWSWE